MFVDKKCKKCYYEIGLFKKLLSRKNLSKFSKKLKQFILNERSKMQRKSKEELTRRGRERERMLILGNLLDMDFSLEESAMLVGLSMKEIYVLMVLDIMEIEDWKIKEEAMEKEKISIAKKLLKEKFGIEDVSRITQLSEEEIRRIMQEKVEKIKSYML